MAKLSLKDVVRTMDNKDPKDVVDDVDMQDYVQEMQDVGIEVLKGLSGQELAAVISFMQSMFCMQLMNDNPLLALAFLKDSDDMSIAMGQALKVAIGIALSEEWR